MVGIRLLDKAKGRETREEDFAALLEGRRAWAYRLALKIVGSPDAAEDVAQAALLKAWGNASALRNDEMLQAWLRKIVVRTALNHLRSNATGRDLRVEPAETPDNDTHLQVTRTLGRLKPEHRAILALALGEGLSYREVAQSLGIPEGTVSSRLNAAKAAFRNLWEED